MLQVEHMRPYGPIKTLTLTLTPALTFKSWAVEFNIVLMRELQGDHEQKPGVIPAVGGIVPLSVGAIDPASAPAAVKQADEVLLAVLSVPFDALLLL